ncbi:EF-hand domain-containing protein D2 homolog isoform X2 [Selaginella moellendorffii]|uniref:EF-hand domain-containing protein D2 homolog isoform X2 n=1 Tax=Selaginella moellendorffii TaxID=88036 RepID=UPI000D1C38EB|nr:EF-hand domain-containing protein D2 homolog isoform X2 [Selaginella moellendorffii]|eukprot:XP_024522663.1 EF-hand domain-containing protein D2 homolog isoform X2 [Selaginella moellendorffii]
MLRLVRGVAPLRPPPPLILSRRLLFDDLPERDKNEYELRSLAFVRQERQIFREEMFERACQRFEMNRFRLADSTLRSVIDSNNDGYITPSELARYLSKWGANLDKQDMEKMVKFADRDKDGKVSFREFSKMIRGEFDSPLGRIPRARSKSKDGS